MDLVSRLVQADFMPHGYCYLWFPEILWLHVLSDGLIALAYFIIPASLLAFVIRRREVPFPWMFLMFASFIVACGATHAMGIWTVWNPDYGVQGLVKLGTAVISMATAATLVPLLPKALALRSPAALEAANRALEDEVAEHRRTEAALQRARAELEDAVARRTAELRRSNERLQTEIEERRRAQEHQQLLLRELSHRVKNTLATVQSLATQTLRNSPSPEAFAEAFGGRLMALAQAHTLLTAGDWRGTSLHDLIAAELAPYRSDERGNAAVDGVTAVLEPKAALALSLTFHELATNAAKHGAFSVPDGRVRVSWRREAAPAAAGDGARLVILWAESGGPPARPPIRRGFGSKLIEQMVAYELDGTTSLEFSEDGLRCTITLPIRATIPAAAGAQPLASTGALPLHPHP